MEAKTSWEEAREYTPDQLRTAELVLEDVRAGVDVLKAIRSHPLAAGGYIGKHTLVWVLRQQAQAEGQAPDPGMLRKIRMKPGRTLSGVTTVTVLTKPYPCPGECIFCPEAACMPKSYLPDEPGAMRGVQHDFDPFDQTMSRLQSLTAIGHPTDKVELLILGGTWSAYPEEYQERFIKRCLDAMNTRVAATLEEAQRWNDGAPHRNVGMVLETRPDSIDRAEIARMRALGATKVQMGVQSLDNHILDRNKRGHSVEQSRQAIRLLRAAGFKIVLHWMPNLLGATLDSDREDFQRLWSDEDMRPDELKIYPTQLLKDTGLYHFWAQGEYKPYTTQELIALISELKLSIPRYCRVNRVIRDIPSGNVVAGNKRTSLRQDIQASLKERGLRCQCIRCREVRGRAVKPVELLREDLVYRAGGAEEHFLSLNTTDDYLAGYLRLSLPGKTAPRTALAGLEDAAIIREVHIYGQSLTVGRTVEGAAQHAGLGSSLIEEAEEMAMDAGYPNMAIIAALGTRGYYRKLGYRLVGTYMVKKLKA